MQRLIEKPGHFAPDVLAILSINTPGDVDPGCPLRQAGFRNGFAGANGLSLGSLRSDFGTTDLGATGLGHVLEGANGLRLAVFGQGEVFGPEVGDGLALLVGDFDLDLH